MAHCSLSSLNQLSWNGLNTTEKHAIITRINKESEDKQVPSIALAAQMGILQLVEYYYETNNYSYNDKLKAMRFAVEKTDLKIICCLNILFQKTDPTMKHFTPLHYAAMFGSERLIKDLLLDPSTQVFRDFCKTTFIDSALHIAIEFGNKSAINALLRAGLYPEEINSDGDTILHWVAGLGNHEVLRIFIESKLFNINRENHNGFTPLTLAIHMHKTNNVRYLVDAPEIDLGKANYCGNTALHWAVRKGTPEILQILVDKIVSLGSKRININKKNDTGYTAFMFAIYFNNIKGVRCLLQISWIDLNIIDDATGQNLIISLAQERNPEIFQLINNAITQRALAAGG